MMKRREFKIYKKEWKEFWRNKDFTNLQKILYRMELESILVYNDKELWSNFLERHKKYFKKTIQNIDKIWELETLSNTIYFSNKINLFFLFHSDFWKRILFSFAIIIPILIYEYCITLFGLPNIFLIKIAVNNPFQMVINKFFIIFVTWLIFYQLFYFITSLSWRREKILIIIKSINRIIKFFVFWLLFLSFYIFFFIGSWDINTDTPLKELFFALSTLLLFDFLVFSLLIQIDIVDISPSSDLIYFQLRFLDASCHSNEGNEDSIPFLFHALLRALNKDIHRVLALEIENIDEIVNQFNNYFMKSHFKEIKLETQELKSNLVNLKDFKLEFFTSLTYTNIMIIIEKIEGFLKKLKISEFKYKKNDLIAPQLTKRLKLISFIFGFIIGVLTLIIRILFFL